MSRYLNNRGEVVPGGFRFLQPETNFLVTAPSWKDLLAAVQKHRMANNIPIGSNFEGEIEDAVCAQAPESWCSDLNPNRSGEVPRAEWPTWAKLLALIAKPEDRGIGSVIERTIGPFGGTSFKVWYEVTFGKSCGCSERRESFDIQFPL
jgi:hypothetical protein